MSVLSDRSCTAATRSVYAACRQRDLRTICTAALRRLNLNYRGYWYYLQYRLKRRRDVDCVPEEDVFRTLRVDPDEIRYLPTTRFDKWENMGEVRSGNWDRPDERFEEKPLVQALGARFEDGHDWEEIEYVQRALEAVANGTTTWNGCRTVDDVQERCRSLDALYERIRDEGFRSQAELQGRDPKSILLSGSFDRSQTDIAVHVGRDGELLFVDGNHRLAIAKSLDLESVPVRVVVRHTRWQSLRERARTGRNLPDEIESHPDLPDPVVSTTDSS